MNNPKVSIVVLNWNGWRDTIECLASVFRVEYPNFEVVIVDNGSIDDSVREISAWLRGYEGRNIHFYEYERDEILKQGDGEDGGLAVHLIKNGKNEGFAGGNNIAAKKAVGDLRAQYVLFLNNDTIVHEDFLTHLINGALSDGRIAALAPLVYRYDSAPTDIVYCFGGTLNRYTGSVTHRFMGSGDSHRLPMIEDVEFLEGSSLLVNGLIFLREGGFDEKYFAYFEDVDLSCRLLQKNYRLACVSVAKIWHKVSRSSNPDKKAFYLIRNLIWFMKKNGTYFQKSIFFTYLPFRIFYLIFIKSKLRVSYIRSILKGVLEGLF